MVTLGNNAAMCNWNLQRGLILSVFTTAHTKKANYVLCEVIDILINLIVVTCSPHVYVYMYMYMYIKSSSCTLYIYLKNLETKLAWVKIEVG